MPRLENEVKLDFKDVLIRPRRSSIASRQKVSLHRSYVFRHSKAEYKGIPIVAANMDCVGTLQMANALAKFDMLTALHEGYDFEDVSNAVIASPGIANNMVVCSGVSENAYKQLKSILRSVPEVKMICLDVANGYGDFLVNHVRRVREEFHHLTIVAGSVVTSELVEELILTGTDIVKVGIGSGSVCTTRTKTGVGYPQLSAVMECADAAHALNGHIMSEGGCTVPGDLAKAFGAGADFVMLGGMLAGHDESGDQPVETVDGKTYKAFYGTASKTGMAKFSPELTYRAAEGKKVWLPYRGPVEHTVRDILGGLRSACTYVGAGQLSELSSRTTFLRVTQQVNEVFRGLEGAET